ncbi:MAG: hypothetical protein ACFFC1_03650 [Promethearchaeota archaeon]
MIKGAKEWDKWFFIQDNNLFEVMSKKVGGRMLYETCGISSAINCVATLGTNMLIKSPGGYQVQPETALLDWFWNPDTQELQEKIRSGVDKIPDQRIPQYYPEAVKQVFNVKAEFHWGSDWDMAIYELQKGNTIQLCIPGHYIALVAYDTTTKEIIWLNSWPGDKRNKRGGNKERMSKDYFDKNTSKYYNIFFGK